MSETSPIVVLKFGGTSVSSRARWETIEAIARTKREDGEQPIIVCSAVSGVSNMLERLLPAALDGAHEEVLGQIRGAHEDLASELGVEVEPLIGTILERLARLALGASLIGEISPKLKAQVMATGELMSTTLGAAFLRQRGLEVTWRDARQMLHAPRQANTNDNRHYLSAACDYAPDEELRRELQTLEEPVVLTQGFIAMDAHGDTVLLGRGGSDTSAAYMAAKLGATRLEIWTDVPGMFTANPRQVTGARLLRKLSYNEAQELATTGAKVLHPRCIDPVRTHKIPLHIRCTPHPEMEGTVISEDVPDFGPQVKAISAKGGIPLVSMESVGMWQQVGFLADVFGVFKTNGLSVDLVATSETNVTVSLDPVANALDSDTIDELISDLSRTCQARAIGPCAAVSLVGNNIRAILHRLGGALEVFEEHKIFMMSQAASDLNLTFVVAEDQADRLVRQLHAMVFGDRTRDALVGPTWRELFHDERTSVQGVAASRRWWRKKREELLEVASQADEALYVYDRDTLTRAAADLGELGAIDRLHYAIKANANPDVLRHLSSHGLHMECVSLGEVEHVMEVLGAEADAADILFTPNFASIDEYRRAFELGVVVTLDNLHPLEYHPEVFAGQEILVRMDPGTGKGHHKHVRTAGSQSKFGVSEEQLDELIALAEQAGATIIGVHAHVGSGIRSSETWAENAVFLAAMADRIGSSARILDLGGGLGVPEKPGDRALDIAAVGESLERFKQAHPHFELWLEPGRYCVATAGVLLARVTQLKQKGSHRYVGIETGMNSLIRPSLYGSFHEIVNLTKLGAPMRLTADIVGPVCESGDVLGYGRRLPMTQEGDVLLIGTCGAYGRVMSSEYNLRRPAREVLI